VIGVARRVRDLGDVGELVVITGVESRAQLASVGAVADDRTLEAAAALTAEQAADRRTLALVGLADKAGVRADALSAADRWRLAIACALAARPSRVVIDYRARNGSARQDVPFFLDLRRAGVHVFVATDDAAVGGYADRIITAREDRLVVSDAADASTLDRTRVIHKLLSEG
jgi:ABC-type ATPase involved in cell division